MQTPMETANFACCFVVTAKGLLPFADSRSSRSSYIIYYHMLQVNLLKWRNLIGSLSREIGHKMSANEALVYFWDVLGGTSPSDTYIYLYTYTYLDTYIYSYTYIYLYILIYLHKLLYSYILMYLYMLMCCITVLRFSLSVSPGPG